MKKMYPRLLTALLLLAVFPSALFAQTSTITGKVTESAKKAPLIGATIVVKGTTTGTTSNADGSFTLKVSTLPPFTLVISSIGYQNKETTISTASTENISIVLDEQIILGQEVIISASRTPESLLKTPVTVEKIDAANIRETAAANFFDALNNVKGVDLGTQSIGFKSVNMRGFGANNNTRVVQWVDGMDNRSPGLGFGFGNVAGISELDVESIEVVPGAASALYGPDALNGIILTTTKDPFAYQGLSVQLKQGINNVDSPTSKTTPLYDYSVRYAHAFNNRFAFKVNAAYFKATDWYADDITDRLDRGRPANFVPGNRESNLLYDGVNLYGDEFNNRIKLTEGSLKDKEVTRTGYLEKDLLSNNIFSFRLGGALHYKITNKIEAILAANYGNGNMIQTAGQRVYYPDYKRYQAKLELRGDNFYLRSYTTQQTAEAYGLATLARTLNTTSSSNADWANDYARAYDGKIEGISSGSASDARAYADWNRIVPGSEAFNAIKNDLTHKLTTQGGARQLDNSDMWHFEGMYNFKNQVKFVDIIAGASYRKYVLESKGTLFPLKNSDTGEEYTVYEYGGYVQVAKTFSLTKALNIRPTLASRYDKNEYLKGGLTPRASVVASLGEHNLRASYQTAFRNPSPGNLFAFNAGANSTELGGTEMIASRANLYDNPAYTEASVNAYRQSGDASVLVKYNPGIIKTEKIKTWEVGHRTSLFNRLYVDGYYFRSRYTDFIANQNFIQPKNGNIEDLKAGSTSQAYQINRNNQNDIKVYGWGIGLDYSLPDGTKISTNFVHQVGTDKNGNRLSDSEVRAKGRTFFNSPENRANLTFSNSRLTRNLGYSATIRWQDRTWWEQGFGDTWVPAFTTLDAQVSYRITPIRSIVKVGGSNLFNQYYTQGYGLPRVGAVYYVSILFDEWLK